MMFVYSPSTNGTIWYAGITDQAPQAGVGSPILPGTVEEIECTDANQFSFIPEVDGNPIYVIVFASNSSAIVVPSNPPAFTNTPPTISFIQPNVNNATNVAVFAPIIVQASAPLNAGTVNNTTVTATPTMTATIAVDSSNPQNIIVTPTANLNTSTTYQITYNTGITDQNGNALASNVVFTFTTASTVGTPDTTPPTVVSANPGSFSTNVNPSITPSIVFSEAILFSSINQGNVTAFIVNNDQQIPGLSFSQSTDLKTLYITGMNLQPSLSYQINILGGTGIGPTDLSGNALASSYVIDFTTSAASSTIVYNVTGNSYDTLQGTNGYINTGELLNSNRSYLVGQIPIAYTFILKRMGTPTGTIHFYWYRIGFDGNYNIFRTLGSFSASSLSTSDQVITLNDSGNTNTLQYQDYISVYYPGGNSSNAVLVRVSNYDAYDGSNTCSAKVDYTNGQIGIYTTADLAGTISTAGS